MKIVFELARIDDAANEILAQNPEKIILFHGEMGAGKTTLIAALCKALGVSDATGSPTFSLVNEYISSSGEKVYHFDVYRLKSEAEALDMGIEEYLDSGHWCFIEWAEKIPNLIPGAHSTITIELLADNRRQVTLSK